MSNPVELLRELVAISSISRESNRGIINFAQNVLVEADWLFEEHTYRDSLGIEKVNLVAWAGELPPQDQQVELALVCHTDTVPYTSEWQDATTLIADGEDLRGCGACDVKGFLACILAAVPDLDAARLSKPFAVVLTSDEEVGCVGARHLLAENAIRARFAIVGEPTSLQPMRAGKGYCLAEVTVSGREAHSAYPERGVSAIYGAARLIVAIEKIVERLRDYRVEGFSPPWTTMNIGEIHGGLAKNIVAPSCNFLLEWRPVPGQDPELVVDLVRQGIAELVIADPNFSCEMRVLRKQEGFAVKEESQLLLALSQLTGKQANTVAFGTEAPWLNKMGADAVVFGPGSMQSAHSPREFVPKAELYRCVEILRLVVCELCG